MTTHPTCLSFVVCTFILFSCKSKQPVITPAAATDIVANNNPIVENNEPSALLNMKVYAGTYEQMNMQHFTVLKNTTAIVTGKKGLKITIDPAIVENEDGTPVDGDISVSILELTNTDELLKSNAATVSNGKLLASGGSYFIELRSKGKKLRIKKGRSIQMQFPQIKEDEMELFYGNRNATGDMNWTKAGTTLEGDTLETTAMAFTQDNDNSGEYLASFMYDENKEPKVYKTLNDPVYYYERKITIKQLVDTINRYKQKIFIDTINAWPQQPVVLLPGQHIDTGFLYTTYGPPRQFILKTYKAIQEENERKAKERIARQQQVAAWQPKSIAGKLQKYYTPSSITSLGWINCDRYYNQDVQPELNIELPYTFNKGSINYFVMLKSFNGLLSGIASIDSSRAQINNLPLGQKAVLVFFAKQNGKIFNCKEELTIKKNNLLKLDMKSISAAEVTKMFGSNVKI